MHEGATFKCAAEKEKTPYVSDGPLEKSNGSKRYSYLNFDKTYRFLHSTRLYSPSNLGLFIFKRVERGQAMQNT